MLFSSAYRSQIESGEYKVYTIENQDVRIVSWNLGDEKYYIGCCCKLDDGHDKFFQIDNNGFAKGEKHMFNVPYVYIATEKNESLTDFEIALKDILESLCVKKLPNIIIKNYSKTLLPLAEQEIMLSDDYIDYVSEKLKKNQTKKYIKPFFYERQNGNNKCLTHLKEYLEKNPMQRFCQALYNLGLKDCDNFNEEPDITLKKMQMKS